MSSSINSVGTISENVVPLRAALRAKRQSAFTPGLECRDGFTAYWLEQVVLRMRRELCWAWRQNPAAQILNATDAIAEVVQRNSLEEQRKRFFAEDETARYLSEQIAASSARRRSRASRGSFQWLAQELKLSGGEVFAVALVLAAARDSATGEVIAALHGDARRTQPTLSLAQRLWDDPKALLPVASRSHALFRMGILLATEEGPSVEWRSPLGMSARVAEFLEVAGTALPAELELLCSEETLQAEPDQPAARSSMMTNLLAQRMCEPIHSLHLIPVVLPFASDSLQAVHARTELKKISTITRRPIFALNEACSGLTVVELQALATICWLRGADLLLPSLAVSGDVSWQTSLAAIPIYVFAAATEDSAKSVRIPTLPQLTLVPLTFAERMQVWQRALRSQVVSDQPEVDEKIIERCAYRFRLNEESIQQIACSLQRDGKAITAERLMAACQQHAGVELGPLATRLYPRLQADELVLQPTQMRQFEELCTAMDVVARVHSQWGTGRAWAEAGISALFAGPPGTGKTMAAEVLAARLDLPMYRVDLSQVVNKYIGETEKNIRQLFDAAERSDILLFFDEADALFGQRTQVKSSNDRYANLEVSYLLQRMETFRGLAVLATNRRKDLDDAFLRRLRFVLEFPLPEEKERLRIWKRCIPEQVDASTLDFNFLARSFALAGGHIRSIILYACLQAAGTQQEPRLTMDTVMLAVRREYEKLDRPLTSEQCGEWPELRVAGIAGVSR